AHHLTRHQHRLMKWLRRSMRKPKVSTSGHTRPMARAGRHTSGVRASMGLLRSMVHKHPQGHRQPYPTEVLGAPSTVVGNTADDPAVSEIAVRPKAGLQTRQQSLLAVRRLATGEQQS